MPTPEQRVVSTTEQQTRYLRDIASSLKELNLHLGEVAKVVNRINQSVVVTKDRYSSDPNDNGEDHCY